MGVARPRLAARADRRERHRVRGVERRVPRAGPADRRAARAAIDAGVLYALDAATGKTLWSSGRTITSFARGGLSAGSGQVYLVTYDNTLYTFGIPMEH